MLRNFIKSFTQNDGHPHILETKGDKEKIKENFAIKIDRDGDLTTTTIEGVADEEEIILVKSFLKRKKHPPVTDYVGSKSKKLLSSEEAEEMFEKYHEILSTKNS